MLRVHIELYARWMEEERRLARATIGRRLSTGVWVGQPLLGFMVAIYASLAIGLAHDWRLWLLGLTFIGLVCFVAHRRPPLRHAARGGELAVVAMACAGVVVFLAR